MKNCALLFDLDGTLFDSEKLSVATFQHTINEIMMNSLYPWEKISDDRIKENIGMRTVGGIFKDLLPDASEKLILHASDILSRTEVQLMDEMGVLFPGVEETLRRLRNKGYSLYVASNGSERYVSRAIESSGLETLFTGIYCAGKQNTTSKVDLVKMLVNENIHSQYIMIGDRFSDIEAGLKNKLITIGCQYGMAKNAELNDADYKVQSFTGIEKILDEMNIQQV